MRRCWIYIFSSVMLIACVSFKKPLAGQYVRSAKGLNNYNTLMLDTNHTFKFGMYWCAGSQIEEGTWARNKNKLILNSFPFVRSNDSVSVFIENKKNNEDDSITLEFIDDSLEMLIGVNVNGFSNSKILDGSVSDIDGIAKILKYKYDSIVANYIGFSEIVIYPDNDNYYKIKMRTENGFSEKEYYSMFHFVNDEWKISKKSFINHNTKKVVRRVVLVDSRFRKHRKKNAYIFVKPT